MALCPAKLTKAPVNMQPNLFSDLYDHAFYEDHRLGDATIREYPHVFSFKESDRIMLSLARNIPWRQDMLMIAGKEIPVPRLQCWMGSPGAKYGYSGLQLAPIGWSEIVLSIRRSVQLLTGIEFNSALLSYYRDGSDSVSWHSDDEPELGLKPIIASVSFGAERVFQLRHKIRKGLPKYRIVLRNGSVLLMGDTLQSNWIHQLPKVKGLSEPRINLTFRNVISRQVI